MELEFRTNRAYCSHRVDDIFGPPLANEGLMAFFPEVTSLGMMVFGWERRGRLNRVPEPRIQKVSGELLQVFARNAGAANFPIDRIGV